MTPAQEKSFVKGVKRVTNRTVTNIEYAFATTDLRIAGMLGVASNLVGTVYTAYTNKGRPNDARESLGEFLAMLRVIVEQAGGTVPWTAADEGME